MAKKNEHKKVLTPTTAFVIFVCGDNLSAHVVTIVNYIDCMQCPKAKLLM